MALAVSMKLISAAFLLLQIWASQATARTLPDASMVERHEQWMTQYGRTYIDDAEKDKRFKIFKENVEYINSVNAAGNRPYKLAINHFGDLTNEEFRATRTGYNMRPHQKSSEASLFTYANVSDVPSSIDWREKGAVTDVKHQGQCGCCWAFSAVAATEGINQISTGNLISLSEKELLDCDTEKQYGCSGGYMNYAFDYIVKNNGLSTESDYPYEAVQGTCNANTESSRVGKITGHVDVPAGESELLKAVANQPVSVAIDGGEQAFQFYKDGVFNGQCGNDLNHAVTAVGFGETSDGTKYWLLKNSWGTNWGENGYMRIVRDAGAQGGLCGLAMQASYPIA